MLRYKILFFVVGLAVLVSSCIEPYGLPDNKSTAAYLVVDGFLNSGSGEVQVKLTRSRPLSEGGSVQLEKGAVIKLEEMDGEAFSLTEFEDAVYKVTGIPVDSDKKYRLTIQTKDAKIFASSFVEVAVTPVIDSVTWLPSQDGVSFRVNTHNDVPQSSRYYMWHFEETWEYNAREYSAFKFEDGGPVAREDHEMVHTCWRSNSSTNILVKSTDRLSANRVFQFPLNFVPAGDGRLGVKYSILVRQVCLDKGSYEFWSKLEQTTENVGGLFDPQPGQVFGNIECISHPSEPALGIFHAGNIEEKRFFLSFRELPDYLSYVNRTFVCEVDTIPIANLVDFPTSGSLLLNQVTEGIMLIGYTYTTASCADCRYQGGTLTKPSFWEN